MIGATLQRQHKQAVLESSEQAEILDEFRSRLEADNVTAWEAQVVAYEADPSKEDPYCRRVEGKGLMCIAKPFATDTILSGITEADVRLQLAEEDSAAHASGEISLHEVTPAGMVIEGLAIEEQQ